jgi:hypothetical protein
MTMRATQALDAINARKTGVFDHSDLAIIGPLLPNTEQDITRIMRRCLEDYGFTVGDRNPALFTNHDGKFMVVESMEDAKLPCADGNDSNTWAVVGDDLPSLIDIAFDYVVGCEI